MRTQPMPFLFALLFICEAAGQDQPALVTFYSVGCRLCGKELAVTIAAGSATLRIRIARFLVQQLPCCPLCCRLRR